MKKITLTKRQINRNQNSSKENYIILLGTESKRYLKTKERGQSS